MKKLFLNIISFFLLFSCSSKVEDLEEDYENDLAVDEVKEVVKFSERNVKFTFNLDPSALEGRVVDSDKMKWFFHRVMQSNIKEKHEYALIGLVLSKEPWESVFDFYKKTNVLEKSAGKDLSEKFISYLAIGAYLRNKFSLFNFYEKKLTSSHKEEIKNMMKSIKAMIQVKESHFPEAVLLWNEIKTKDLAVVLNLLSVNLAYGNITGAHNILQSNTSKDSLVSSFKATTVRHLSLNNQEICLDENNIEPSYLFNCGLYFEQNLNDQQKGDKLKKRAIENPSWLYSFWK